MRNETAPRTAPAMKRAASAARNCTRSQSILAPGLSNGASFGSQAYARNSHAIVPATKEQLQRDFKKPCVNVAAMRFPHPVFAVPSPHDEGNGAPRSAVLMVAIRRPRGRLTARQARRLRQRAPLFSRPFRFGPESRPHDASPRDARQRTATSQPASGGGSERPRGVAPPPPERFTANQARGRRAPSRDQTPLERAPQRTR